MITIDISELESERENLFDFLKPKIRASITASGKILTIDPREETLTSKDIKTFVKRFLHHRSLSELYKVTEEKEVVRIVKIKKRKGRRSEKKGREPSSYDTLPYFFPINRSDPRRR